MLEQLAGNTKLFQRTSPSKFSRKVVLPSVPILICFSAGARTRTRERLLERMATGVNPAAGGQALAKGMGAVLASYDLTVNDTRRDLRGETDQVRIAYVPSVEQYLGGPLREVRRSHPQTVLKLTTLAPGEQIIALRASAPKPLREAKRVFYRSSQHSVAATKNDEILVRRRLDLDADYADCKSVLPAGLTNPVQPADLQNCEILSVVHVTQQIHVRGRTRKLSTVGPSPEHRERKRTVRKKTASRSQRFIGLICPFLKGLCLHWSAR